MSVSTDELMLREALITELRKLDAIRTDAVASAFRAVPRSAFIPEIAPEQAYEAENAYVTKRDADGVALSSVSAARIQAFMLEQADIRPGMRVLEIGSGGYNAALIAELVGPEGAVTSVDIDPDVIDRARRLLSAAGYGQVHAITADGAAGVAERAPYDRIVVTVEANDLAPSWVGQLVEGGRIVVPLRWRGLTRSIAFVRTGDRLVSAGYELCGFVPMRGEASDPMRLVVLHDADDEQVGIRIDMEPFLDPARLRDAWTRPRVEAWSGVTMGLGLPYDDLELWLATALQEFGLMAATRRARDRGLVLSWSAGGVSTALDSVTGSFAYLAMRPTNTERTLFEFGAAGHGPRGRDTAERMAAHIRTWDRHQREVHARFLAEPTADPVTPTPGSPARVVERACYRFTVAWPGH